MLCSELSLVKGNRLNLEACVLKCKCWGCENCEPGRRENLRQMALAGQPNKFLTLTVNPKHGVDADERARALLWAWRVLVKRMQRKLKTRTIPYLWVMEATKNGEPHLHILMRCGYVDQGFVSACMAELINAPIVHIRAIKEQSKMAAYVAKYCSKDARRFAGCKRFGYTKGWIVDEAYLAEKAAFKTDGWRVCNYSLQTLEREILLAGGVVENTGKDRLLVTGFDDDPSLRGQQRKLEGWLSPATAHAGETRGSWPIQPGEYDDALPADIGRKTWYRRGKRDKELEPWVYNPRFKPPANWTRTKRRGSVEDELHTEEIVCETVDDVAGR